MTNRRSARQSFAALGALAFTYRRILVVALHLALWSLSFVGAFCLRFDFNIAMIAPYFKGIILLCLLLFRAAAAWSLGAFRGLWRYTGVRDLEALLKATTLSSLMFVGLVTMLGTSGFPRSIYIIDWLGAVVLVGGTRFAVRLVQELVEQAKRQEAARRLLIIGAGSTGEALLRDIQRNQKARYQVVGFVDDDPAKLNGSIHNTRVLGTLAEAPALILKHAVDEVVVAIPSARGKLFRHILDACKPTGVPVRTIPSTEQLIDGHISLRHIRDVAIEDLLGRAPVALDQQGLSHFLHQEVVLITGAGGSIGSELCRQVCRFGPARVVLVEHAEQPLFQMEEELTRLTRLCPWVTYIANICDPWRMHAVFAAERPTVVLHAAAHKHVSMMERNPSEAIKNNIFGTRLLADLADTTGVRRFVMVSTDKAVNPTSVMGASKRIAEMYIQSMGERSQTMFSIVRFGNVLGSQGSVIPIFKEQIAHGGPVTVTHPEMRRYFMTIPEACQLVLQAGALGRGGELFVLDMGEPVKIIDLARDLITLSGLIPGEDIDIEIVGARHGEKLFEELSLSEEKVDRTQHPKIFTGRVQAPVREDLLANLARLEALVQTASPPSELRTALTQILPEYQPTLAPALIRIPIADPAPLARRSVGHRATS